MKEPLWEHWQHYLDSLSTKGGNIICTFLVVVSLIVAMYLTGDRDLYRDLIIGFTSALLVMLKGDSSRQQMIDRKESVMPPPTVSTGKVENMNVTEAPKGDA